MKVLKGTAAWIEGKKFKEGSVIPQKYEKEFEKYLIEIPESVPPKQKEVPKAKETK